MEDGSALTPLVANHLMFSGQNAHSNLPLAHSSQTSSVQYIRMLAKLVNCPLYLRPQASSQQQQQNSTKSGVASIALTSHQQPPLVGFGSDEAKNNALLFECLRHKPVEQIVQRIPLELLQQSQPTGDISIASRFLKNSALQIEAGSLDSPLMSSFKFEQQQQQSSQRQLNSLDFSQLKRLVMHITREQLDRERLAAEVKLDKDNGDNNTNLDAPQLSELFTAIYWPTSASLRPLFGPVIDGTIIPVSNNNDDGDVSMNMLKSSSNFGHRDLMIGISRPVFGTYNNNNEGDEVNEDDAKQELRSDYFIADRISEKLEQEGVSSEQAIEMVNLFVRSFYRHHNQEIANSLINHYLNNANQPMRKRVRFNLSSFSGKNKAVLDDGEAKLRQQQLALLQALLELFRDSLTNVPVLKTALIHAAKQLDPLLDVFAGQQFEKWQQGQLEGPSRNNNNLTFASNMDRNSNLISSASATAMKGEPLERRKLLESFAHFARQLFAHSEWPLKLHSPISTPNTPVQQPKATYLYQLDSSLLIKEVQVALERLKLDYKKEERFDRRTLLSSLKDNLEGVLVKLQTRNFERHLSFACAFEFGSRSKLDLMYEEGEGEEVEEDKEDVLDHLKEVVCSKLGILIARFVSTGNLNVQLQQISDRLDDVEDDYSIEPLPDQASKYARECLTNPADHHLVQASSSDSSIAQELRVKSKLECQLRLNKLTISYLFTSESDSDDESRSNPNQNSPQQGSIWTVFNLFSQQMASLLKPKSLWTMREVSTQNYDQKSSLISRASFWSNFIPALNCSKTQPIIPASLLATSSTLPSSLNSSLLSLNLAFSCQQGAKTSIDVMESLIANMEQQLESNIERWNSMQFSSRLAPTISQNHHNLRMANMSQSGSADESQQQDQQQQSSEQQVENEQIKQLTGNSNNSLKSELIQVSRSSNEQDNIHIKYVGIVLTACSLVVSITLASGVFVVVRQRMKWNRNRRKSRQQVSFGGSDHQEMDCEISEHSQQQQQQAQHQETTLSFDESNGFQTSQMVIPNNIDNSPVEKNNNDDNYIKEQEINQQMLEQFEQNFSYDINDQNVFKDENNDRNFSTRNNLLYLDGSVNGIGIGNFRAQTISLCQSHSSLEVRNDFDGRSRHLVHLETSPSDQTTDLRSDQAEPIMMPILSTPLNRSATVERGLSCLNGSVNDHYGGSSSETQNQSTSLASSSKKRVKISDPVGTARRSKQTMGYNHHNNDRDINQLQLTQNSTLYCPVHHNLSSNQTLSIEPNLYVEDNLNANSNIHVWNGAHINLVDNHRLDQIELNCDQYTTENVPLPSYFTTSQAFNCNDQTNSNQQNMRALLNNKYASFNQANLNQFARPGH